MVRDRHSAGRRARTSVRCTCRLGEASHDVQPSSPPGRRSQHGLDRRRAESPSPAAVSSTGGQERHRRRADPPMARRRRITAMKPVDGMPWPWIKQPRPRGSHQGHGYQLRHGVYDGTSWSSSAIKIVENLPGRSLVIDGNDELRRVRLHQFAWTLEYMHHDGTTWTSTRSPRAPVRSGWDCRRLNNHPHISYTAYGQYCGNELRLASHDGTEWSSQGVDVGSNRGCESAILGDGNDHVIAYQDRSASSEDRHGQERAMGRLHRQHRKPSSDIYPGYMTSMAMDTQGQFHIAHFEEQDDDLRYSTGAPGGPWTTAIVEASGHTGRDPSIAVDAADRPHIVYHTERSESEIRHA